MTIASKNTTYLSFLAFLFLLIPEQSLYSQIKGVTVTIDQDFFVSPFDVNEDRNYTMGVGIVLLGKKLGSKQLVLPFFRAHLDTLIGLGKLKAEKSMYSLEIVSSNFTPLQIETPEIVPDDRPYGSLVAIGSSKLSVYGDSDPLPLNDYSISSSFYLGALGLPIGEAVQKGIHGSKLFPNRADPEGWDNQISDGFEPTLLYRIALRKPIARAAFKKNPNLTWFQMNGFVDAMAGWYVSSAAGLNFRLGLSDKPFWALNGNTLSNTIAHDPSANANRKFNFFLFSNVTARWMGYNALLQGQFRKSVYTLNENQITHLIREFDVGLAMSASILSAFQINIIWTAFKMRTPEFRTPLSRNHYWGSLALSINW